MRRKILFTGAVASTLAACLGLVWLALQGGSGARGIPNDPEEVTLFSIRGDGEPAKEQGTTSECEWLYEYPVLGKIAITDPARRREIVAAVKRDIRTGSSNQAKCFFPRHVLRVVKSGTTTDVVICYECRGYQIHVNGKQSPDSPPPIGAESMPLLNQILADAGVPVAPLSRD